MKEHRTGKRLVQFWAEFTNWQKRAVGEAKFFESRLREYSCRKVFDAALGEGFDAIRLIEAGFEVTANEIDSAFYQQAMCNAAKEGVELRVIDYDWQSIPDELAAQFDAVLCLGNSLTYLHDRAEQESAARNFRKMVRPGGIVIIDHRNYDYMLDNREEILANPQNNFRYSRRFYYCGEHIIGYPIEITDENVQMEYLDTRTGEKQHLELYPFRRLELIALMEKSGLPVAESYGDFQRDNIDVRSEGTVDFYQHIGVKQ